jgi:hypothetical protein
MTERGVFAMHRGWFDHPVFATEPFTEREAWAWLISEAAWCARIRRIGSAVVELKRGQLAASIRFLAERWQWSKSRVDRFLIRLKNGTMIGTDSGTGILVITICNYDKYQILTTPNGTANGTPSGTSSGTAAGQTKDLKQEERTVPNGTDAPSASPVRSAVDIIWTDYPHLLASLSGRTEAAVRGWIGKVLKRHAPEVALPAFAAAVRARTGDPFGYVTRMLNQAPRGSPAGGGYASVFAHLTSEPVDEPPGPFGSPLPPATVLAGHEHSHQAAQQRPGTGGGEVIHLKLAGAHDGRAAVA